MIFSPPNPRSRAKRTQIFISYSHQDAAWLTRLRVHLKPLEQKYGVNVWDDSRIESGSKWRKEIRKAIESARAAVLLVSADFIASDFIRTDELPPLLVAAEEGGATILPLILSPCRYAQEGTLSQFQSVNPPSRPLTGMTKHEQEEIFVKVASDIEKIFTASNRAAEAPTTQPPGVARSSVSIPLVHPPHTFLGGEDIESRLVDYLADEFKIEQDVDRTCTCICGFFWEKK